MEEINSILISRENYRIKGKMQQWNLRLQPWLTGICDYVISGCLLRSACICPCLSLQADRTNPLGTWEAPPEAGLLVPLYSPTSHLPQSSLALVVYPQASSQELSPSLHTRHASSTNGFSRQSFWPSSPWKPDWPLCMMTAEP